MGVRLIREVLDHAPSDLTPAELVVLLVLAHDARDSTRECWPGIDTIAERARMHPTSLRRMFTRWGNRVPPMEVRVAIGKTADGRPLYAARGHRTVYRLPDLAPIGATTGSAFEGERRNPDDKKGATTSPERRNPLLRPLSHEPSENRHLSRGSNAVSLLAAMGASERETDLVIEKIKSKANVRNLNAYVAKLAETGDLVDLLADVRGQGARQATADAYRLGRPCSRCAVRNRVGAVECEQCHAPQEAS
jgi:hypothetical protein